jgi:hypothetical protein
MAAGSLSRPRAGELDGISRLWWDNGCHALEGATRSKKAAAGILGCPETSDLASEARAERTRKGWVVVQDKPGYNSM